MPTLGAPIARSQRRTDRCRRGRRSCSRCREVLADLVGVAAAEAPVQVGRDGCVALGREALAHAEQLRRDAVALHHHDDAGPRRRGRGRRREERNGDVDHVAASYPAYAATTSGPPSPDARAQRTAGPPDLRLARRESRWSGTRVHDDAVARRAVDEVERLGWRRGDGLDRGEARGAAHPVQCGLVGRPPVADVAVELGEREELGQRTGGLALDVRREPSRSLRARA